MVFYFEDGNLCFQNAEGHWYTPLTTRKEKQQFMTIIWAVRTDLGIPQ